MNLTALCDMSLLIVPVAVERSAGPEPESLMWPGIGITDGAITVHSGPVVLLGEETPMRTLKAKGVAFFVGLLALLLALASSPAVIAQDAQWLRQEQIRQQQERLQWAQWQRQEQIRQLAEQQQWQQWAKQEQARQLAERQQWMLWQQQERIRQMYQR
jgi:hypothetical protein